MAALAKWQLSFLGTTRSAKHLATRAAVVLERERGMGGGGRGEGEGRGEGRER